MEVYIYQADTWCEDCGVAIRNTIIYEGHAPEDPDDEKSYNSDEFPKGPYSEGGGESDCPEHCAAQGECINALDLGGNSLLVGCFLDNPLTSVGVEYIKEAIDEGGVVAEYWRLVYSDYL